MVTTFLNKVALKIIYKITAVCNNNDVGKPFNIQNYWLKITQHNFSVRAVLY